MERGNVLIITAIVAATVIALFLFIAIVFMSHVNSVLYNFKLNVYSIARSGIIAVNKNKANEGNFSYDSRVYLNEIERMLKENYKLNNDMKNEERLISSVSINDFKIYTKGKKDDYTKIKCDDNVLHMVLNVKIRPIIMRDLLERFFCFEIHEDVNLNTVKM